MPLAPTDTAFLLHPTPVGEVLIASTPEAVIACHPTHGDAGPELAALELALHRAPVPGQTDAAVRVCEQLDEYFAGHLEHFDVPLDWSLVSGFARDALEAVTRIPYGETASYGEVAIMGGRPRAARAVGTACATTPFSIIVPVHRVIRADGSIGEYGGHPETKRFLLDLEARVGAAVRTPTTGIASA